MLVGLNYQPDFTYKQVRSWARRRYSKNRTFNYRPCRQIGINATRLRKASYGWWRHRWIITYAFVNIKQNYCNSICPNLGFKLQYQCWWLPYPKYKEWRY